MLSAREIASVRRDFAAMLPDRAMLQRPTSVSDGAGGQSTSWGGLADNVPCRLWVRGGGEDDASGGERISDEANGLVTFAAGQDITEADRITVGGQAFDVLLVRKRGTWEMTTRCEVREIKG